MILLRTLGIALILGCSHAPPTPAAPVAIQPAIVNGSIAGPAGKLRVDDGGTGTGAPVILVHGLAGDRHTWDAELAHLRTSRRALAFDLHGFGESAPSGSNDYSIDSMVADLAAVVDATHAPRVILVGHSFGADVVGAFAGKYPDRVAGLIVVDPTPDFSGASPEDLDETEKAFIANRHKQWEGMLRGSAPGVSERVLATLDATAAPAFDGTLHAMIHYDPKPAFTHYAGPKLAIIGEGMERMPISLHHVVPMDAKVMKDVSHWPMLDRPDELAGLVDAFLATIR